MECHKNASSLNEPVSGFSTASAQHKLQCKYQYVYYNNIYNNENVNINKYMTIIITIITISIIAHSILLAIMPCAPPWGSALSSMEVFQYEYNIMISTRNI